jgi:hypothetical protein
MASNKNQKKNGTQVNKPENILLNAALTYADLNWSIIPIRPDKKAPYVRWKPFQEKRATKEQIINWWEKYPQARIGIVTGKISDLVIVDFDGPEAKPLFEENVCKLPDTLEQATGRGSHAGFKYPADKNGIKTRPNYNGLKGVDLKADGGYIVAAPSPYDSEKNYKWVKFDPVLQGLEKLPEMPKEMVDFFSKASDQAKAQNKKPGFDGVDHGERDDEIYKYSINLKNRDLSFEEAEVLVMQKARNCRPPFPEKEALKCLKSAYKGKDSTLESPDFIEELNKRYFVSKDGGKTLVFHEEYDHDLEIDNLKSLSFTHFKQFYQNELVVTGYKRNGEPIKKQKGVAWLAHPNRRQYEGIILRPNGDLPNYYNLWKGWPISPKKGDWSKLREHIKYNISQRKPEVYDYILKWMAFAVQHPNRPSEVALVMRGKRGVGKSILGNLFGKLFGQHFRHIFSSKHLVGHFNSHLRDCIFLFADEAFWAGEKSAEGVLKGLITERTLNIEGKGKDIVRTKNMLHIMMASNSDWVVPAGLEERRFCILDVGDKHIQDKVYFGAIYEQMENGGYAAMLHDLLDLDLSDFDIRDVPDTQGLRDQKLLSMDPQTAWWFQKLKDGSLPSKNGQWGIVETNALYENYVHTVGRAGVSHKGMRTSLGIKLKKLLPGKYPISKKIQVEKRCFDENYNFTGTKKIRVSHYVLPPLGVCRRCFEKIANMKGYNWPEEPEIITEEEKYPEF